MALDPIIGGALVSGAANLFSGFIRGNQDKRNVDTDVQLQKEFAKNGIRWKVADAKAAGIHPLAAIGANTVSYQPQRVGSTDFGISQFGQDISRAINSTKTAEEKEIDILQKRLLLAQIEGQEINNENNKNPPTPPSPSNNSGIPLGGVSAGDIQMRPDQVTASKQLGVTAGTKAFYTDYVDDSGDIWRMPSQDVTDILESSLPDWLRHNIYQTYSTFRSWLSSASLAHRKELSKALIKVRPKPPAYGYEYRWNFSKAAWRLVRVTGYSQLYDNPKFHKGYNPTVPYKLKKSH